MNKLLVIGLDGAPFPLVDEWAQEGYLPNLKRLIERGCFGILNSTMPVHSPTAWASFITGMNPGKHGVFDFVQRERTSYRLRVVRAEQIPSPSLWRLLSDSGRTVGVMNVPMTYPPEPVNGFLISGLGTPDYASYCYPEGLGEQLTMHGYRVNNKFFFDTERQDEWLDDIFTMTEQRGQTAVKLLSEEQPEFFMVVFRNTDEICHFFWHHMDKTHPAHDPNAPERYKSAIRDLYQLADTWVGRLVEVVGEESNVVVMSDHGAGPLYQDVFLNEWLWENGWLVVKEQPAQHKRVWQLARRLGLTRERISSSLTALDLHRLEVLIKQILGERIYMLPRDDRPEFMNAVDWSRTKAYSFGYYGQIYINLKGREPSGIVSRDDEYELLRTEIADKLKRLSHPSDGHSVVDHVYFKEDIYHGPHVGRAPDLLAVMRNFSYTTRKGYEFAEKRGQIFHDPYTAETGSHRLEGILVAAGPDLQRSHRLAQAYTIFELTPTLLHLMQCSVPAFMDGDVIHEIFDSLYWAEHPIKRSEVTVDWRDGSISDWEAEQEKEVIERLKQLGYLG